MLHVILHHSTIFHRTTTKKKSKLIAIHLFRFPFEYFYFQLFTFPLLQQFGLLFADRSKAIGLTASEITTIINLNPCITSCVGKVVIKSIAVFISVYKYEKINNEFI